VFWTRLTLGVLPTGRDEMRQDLLELVHPHLADLRRTTSPETPFSSLSHLIWSARAKLPFAAQLPTAD
jgi:hypothetical protein